MAHRHKHGSPHETHNREQRRGAVQEAQRADKQSSDALIASSAQGGGTGLKPVPPGQMILARLGLLCLAVALTLVATLLMRSLWWRLPIPSWTRVDWRLASRARAHMTGPAREGLLLVVNSDQFGAAIDHTDQLPDVEDGFGRRAAELRDPELAGPQWAALTMLRLRSEGVPLADWWPEVRMYLEGPGPASYEHFLPELLDADCAIYTTLGMGPGTACRTSLSGIGGAHGPFLQYFVAGARLLADDRRRAGDEQAAAACERTVRRLLRTWVLLPGPTELRLLAAALLADTVEPHGSTSAPATQSEGAAQPALAAKLRAWRAAYRQRVAALPAAPALLHIGDELTPANAAAVTLSHRLMLSVWSVAAILPVAVAALVTAIFWLFSPATRRPARAPSASEGLAALRESPVAGAWGSYLPAVAFAALVLLAGTVAIECWPGTVYDDFLRIGNLGQWTRARDLGWPRLPMIGLAAGGGVIAVAGLLGLRWRQAGDQGPERERGGFARGIPVAGAPSSEATDGRSPKRAEAAAHPLAQVRVANFARVLVAAWLALCGAALVTTAIAEYARREYERQSAIRPPEQLAAIADPNADGLLADLRAWQP